MKGSTQHQAVLLAVFMLPLLAAPARADDAPPAVCDAIVALTQQLMDAIVPGKADVWRRALADDALITDEFGRRQTKQEAVDSIHAFPAGISGSIAIRDAHVRSYGNTAVIDCEEYERETYFGQSFVVRYLATATYVRREDAWRLVAMEDVTLPTPPPLLRVDNLRLTDYTGTFRYAPQRAWTIEASDGRLRLRTRPAAPEQVLEPIARDAFMGSDDERNLLVFRRDAAGEVVELIERRKFNDLHLRRDRDARR